MNIRNGIFTAYNLHLRSAPIDSPRVLGKSRDREGRRYNAYAISNVRICTLKGVKYKMVGRELVQGRYPLVFYTQIVLVL